MLRDGKEVPYASKGVTIIYKDDKGEWQQCHNRGDKRQLLEKPRPKESLCVWTGQWHTDAFEIDWEAFALAFV
jgi:hypothetical protein